jgi:hypothetical protein
MVEWHLVLPLDHSPAEERWFAELQAKHPDLRMHWVGKTQIESELAANPHIARSYVPGSPQQLALEWLAHLNAEQAGLPRGVPDALERSAKLGRLLNEVDPDFEFEVTTGNDRQVIAVRPRDAGALARRPVQGALKFEVEPGSAEAEALENFMRYGAPLEAGDVGLVSVQLNGLPGGLGQLIPDDAPAAVSISQGPFEAIRGQVMLKRSGVVISRLPMSLVGVTKGPLGGFRAVARHDSGGLQIEMRVNPGGVSEPLSLESRLAGLAVHEALQIVGWASSLSDADAITLAFAEPVTELRLKGRPRLGPEQAEPHESINGIFELLSAMHRIEDACGIALPILEDLSAREARDLLAFDALVAGREVPWVPMEGTVEVPAGLVRKVVLSHVFPRMNLQGKSTGPAEVVLARTTFPFVKQIEMSTTDLLVVNAGALRKTLSTAPPSDSTAMIPVNLQADALTRCAMRIAQDEADSR